MGKTYRKEQQYKKARERDEVGHDKQIDHDHERTVTRRQLHNAKTHWQDDDFEDDLN